MAVTRLERLAFTCGIPLGPAAVTMRTADLPAEPVVVREAEHDTIAFRALLAFMAVLLFRPQDQLPFLEPLHLADLTGAVAVIALMMGRLARGLPVTRFTPEVIGVFAFSAVMLLTIPTSYWPGGSLDVFLNQFAKIVLIFLVIVNTLTTRERVDRYITVVVAGGSYVGVRAVIDYARGVNLVEGGRVAGAVGGLFGNPNDMALNMVTFLPLAIVLMLQKSRPVLRLLGAGGAAAMALAMVFSKSRGGTVGMIAMLLVLVYQMRRVKPGIAAAVIAVSIAAVPFLPSSFAERMASIFDADQDPTGSREARKTLLKEGWRAFVANPITGLGAGQFTNYNPDERVEAWRQTHNAPLQVASELGIAGLAVFLFLVWNAFAGGLVALRAVRAARGRVRPRAPANRSRRRGRRAESREAKLSDQLDWFELHGGIVIAGIVGWFVSANFASVAYYWTFYLMLGLAGALRDVTLNATAPLLSALPRHRHVTGRAA
jgi:O-antigen ligase